MRCRSRVTKAPFSVQFAGGRGWGPAGGFWKMGKKQKKKPNFL
jgi:hypothetical protein